MAESEMIVSEFGSYSAGGLRLRDGDILVVKTHRNVSQETMNAIRKRYEDELSRLGVAEPKVLSVPGEISFEVIERA